MQKRINYSELSNEDLLSLYKDLNKTAFDEFFKRNSPIIFSFIASRLQNASEAEEVLQDTFFRIHKYILKYDPSQNAMSWTFTIARNCLLDCIAKRKKLTEIKEEAHRVSEMQTIENNFQQEAHDQLQHLLSLLPAEERRLLEERFFAEISYEELAKTQGVTPAGVRQRISRIVRKLRQNL